MLVLGRTRLSVQGLPPHLCWSWPERSWRFLFPEAWCCPSDHLASAAVSSHKGLLKAESVFCHPFPLLTAFPHPPWALRMPESVGRRDCQEIWALQLFLFGSWQKPGSFQHLVCEKEILSLRVTEQVVGVGVCVHHGCSILPALAWTFCLAGTGSFPYPREFLVSFHTEVVSRTASDLPSPLLSVPRVIWDALWLGATESSIEGNNETKKMTIAAYPAHSWLAVEICVLDSKQIMNRQINFLKKCRPKRKTKQPCAFAKAFWNTTTPYDSSSHLLL